MNQEKSMEAITRAAEARTLPVSRGGLGSPLGADMR